MHLLSLFITGHLFLSSSALRDSLLTEQVKLLHPVPKVKQVTPSQRDNPEDSAFQNILGFVEAVKNPGATLKRFFPSLPASFLQASTDVCIYPEVPDPPEDAGCWAARVAAALQFLVDAQLAQAKTKQTYSDGKNFYKDLVTANTTMAIYQKLVYGADAQLGMIMDEDTRGLYRNASVEYTAIQAFPQILSELEKSTRSAVAAIRYSWVSDNSQFPLQIDYARNAITSTFNWLFEQWLAAVSSNQAKFLARSNAMLASMSTTVTAREAADRAALLSVQSDINAENLDISAALATLQGQLAEISADLPGVVNQFRSVFETNLNKPIAEKGEEVIASYMKDKFDNLTRDALALNSSIADAASSSFDTALSGYDSYFYTIWSQLGSPIQTELASINLTTAPNLRAANESVDRLVEQLQDLFMTVKEEVGEIRKADLLSTSGIQESISQSLHTAEQWVVTAKGEAQDIKELIGRTTREVSDALQNSADETSGSVTGHLLQSIKDLAAQKAQLLAQFQAQKEAMEALMADLSAKLGLSNDEFVAQVGAMQGLLNKVKALLAPGGIDTGSTNIGGIQLDLIDAARQGTIAAQNAAEMYRKTADTAADASKRLLESTRALLAAQEKKSNTAAQDQVLSNANLSSTLVSKLSAAEQQQEEAASRIAGVDAKLSALQGPLDSFSLTQSGMLDPVLGRIAGADEQVRSQLESWLKSVSTDIDTAASSSAFDAERYLQGQVAGWFAQLKSAAVDRNDVFTPLLAYLAGVNATISDKLAQFKNGATLLEQQLQTSQVGVKNAVAKLGTDLDLIKADRVKEAEEKLVEFRKSVEGSQTKLTRDVERAVATARAPADQLIATQKGLYESQEQTRADQAERLGDLDDRLQTQIQKASKWLVMDPVNMRLLIEGMGGFRARTEADLQAQLDIINSANSSLLEGFVDVDKQVRDYFDQMRNESSDSLRDTLAEFSGNISDLAASMEYFQFADEKDGGGFEAQMAEYVIELQGLVNRIVGNQTVIQDRIADLDSRSNTSLQALANSTEDLLNALKEEAASRNDSSLNSTIDSLAAQHQELMAGLLQAAQNSSEAAGLSVQDWVTQSADFAGEVGAQTALALTDGKESLSTVSGLMADKRQSLRSAQDSVKTVASDTRSYVQKLSDAQQSDIREGRAAVDASSAWASEAQQIMDGDMDLGTVIEKAEDMLASFKFWSEQSASGIQQVGDGLSGLKGSLNSVVIQAVNTLARAVADTLSTQQGSLADIKKAGDWLSSYVRGISEAQVEAYGLHAALAKYPSETAQEAQSLADSQVASAQQAAAAEVKRIEDSLKELDVRVNDELGNVV